MIKNKSRVNQCGQIRGGRSGATTTHHRTRRGCFGCPRPRRGGYCRAYRQTWTRAWASFRQSGKLQLLIPFIWQPWRVDSSEDQFDGRLLWRDPGFFGKRRLCVPVTSAFFGRLLKTGPEFETYRGLAPSPRFPNPCRSASAWVNPHPSRIKLAILQAAEAPAAAMSPSTSLQSL